MLPCLVIECRGPDEPDGHAWCCAECGLESRRDLLECDEHVDMREAAPLRGAARGTLGMFDEASKAMPPRLPSSVDVRSMLATPGAEEKRSLRLEGGPFGARPLEPCDIMDARLFRRSEERRVGKECPV